MSRIPRLLVVVMLGGWLLAAHGAAAPQSVVSAPSSPLRLIRSRSVDVTIHNTSTTDVVFAVVRSSLNGPDGPLQKQFVCFGAANGHCSGAQTATITPGRANTVPLTIDTDFTLNGEFKGSIWIADAAGNEFDFPLTVDASSDEAVRRGLAAIFAGALLTWFMTRYLRGRSQRIDALVPAVELRDTLTALLGTLDHVKDTTKETLPTLRTRIDDMIGTLTVKSLDKLNYLPPRIPQPWSAPRAAAYGAFLSSSSLVAAALTALVKNGVEVAAARWDANSSAIQQRVIAALRDLDAKSVSVQTAVAAQAAVVQALQLLQTNLKSDGVPDNVTKGLGAAAPEPSLANLRIEQERIGGAAWLAWFVVTLAAGYAAMIMPNPGFGASGDLFKCFMWGLGVQAAGHSIQSLSPTTATTVFNVSVPKVVR